MNLTRRPVLERWVLGGVVLVAPVGSSEILRLDGTAADLWSRIGPTGVELDDVVAALAADYSADPGQVRTDVIAAVDDMARADVVDRRPPGFDR